LLSLTNLSKANVRLISRTYDPKPYSSPCICLYKPRLHSMNLVCSHMALGVGIWQTHWSSTTHIFSWQCYKIKLKTSLEIWIIKFFCEICGTYHHLLRPAMSPKGSDRQKLFLPPHCPFPPPLHSPYQPVCI
jgi:hypothetical protein